MGLWVCTLCMYATLCDLADRQICGFTFHRRVQRQGGLDGTTEIHPAGLGEISNHKQLVHHLTARVFCFLSLCWVISGVLWCWALSIGTLERSVSWFTAGTPLCLGIHSFSAPTILCCPTRLALCVSRGSVCSKGTPYCLCKETYLTFHSSPGFV